MKLDTYLKYWEGSLLKPILQSYYGMDEWRGGNSLSGHLLKHGWAADWSILWRPYRRCLYGIYRGRHGPVVRCLGTCCIILRVTRYDQCGKVYSFGLSEDSPTA